MKSITENIKAKDTKDYFDSIVNAKTEDEVSAFAKERDAKLRTMTNADKQKANEDYLAAIDTIMGNMDSVIAQAKEDVFKAKLKEVPSAFNDVARAL